MNPPRTIDRGELLRLLETGAQLVDVLPAREYEEEHLPGAVNLPLRELGARARQELDGSRAIVVYCYDALCDMSPRAAWRLAALGFADVSDYAASKADWIAAGLPTDGNEHHIRALSAADRDAPTCHVDERADRASDRLRAAGTDVAIVVNDRHIVLGRLRLGRFEETEARAVREVMEEGPATIRADTELDDLLARMQRRDVAQVVVTTPQGCLLGLLRRERADVEAKDLPPA